MRSAAAKFEGSLRAGVVVAIVAWLAQSSSADPFYQQSNLVSDGSPQSVPAAHTDPNLVNPWGLVFNPTGFSWVADNATGVSTLYDGLGVQQSLVVTVPGLPGGVGSPTGIVFSGDSNFVVTDGVNSAPARFIFATESGTISGWNPGVPPPAPSTQAQPAVNNSTAGAVYKGLAIGTNASGEFLYATDFHNNRIDVFSSTFAPATLAGSFVDPNVPAGFAPFGIQNIGGRIFVTYAQQDNPANAHDNINGAGQGIVSIFDTNGNLISHLIGTGGVLNSPWGLTMAPANFGQFSNDLLVGNFGDGHINAFDPTTGQFLGTLRDAANNPIAIDGLWALQFGNGVQSQGTNQLFFTAGTNDEANGLYGKLSAVPEPGSALLLALGALVGLVVAQKTRRSRSR